jgi:hypothetical protein
MFNDKTSRLTQNTNVIVMQSSRYDGLDMQPGWDRQQMGKNLGKKISWEAASWKAGKKEEQTMDKIRTDRAGGFETSGR